MDDQLSEKTDKYESLLETALSEVSIAPDADTPLGEVAAEFYEMAESYHRDGLHFRENDDDINALAAFSYGHAWLDAGARIGVFSVPSEGHLFTI